MRIEVLFGRWSLSFRGSLDFESLWQDPRGLTGSELGCVRIAEWLATLGHDVTLHTVSAQVGKEFGGLKIRSIDDPIEPCDAVISINEPDLLRAAPAGAFRVCAFWINDVSFAKVGFDEHVDLFCSPSSPHLGQMLSNPAWHRVEVGPEHPNGKETYSPDPTKWTVVPLGCDPERFAHQPAKIPGRVVHCSSPDRGLHWVLQEWPAIRRAVPHASLHIFYRLDPWIHGFDQTPYFPPIEPLRARANYVQECLARFREHGGMGVTVRDSVSRETIEREMAQSQVLAHACDTTTWSEGFSCTLLEGCAARACPITTDCDALGRVYGDVLPLTPRLVGQDGLGEWVPTWRNNVIRALTDESWRESVNDKAEAFARELTWKRTTERILEEIERRRGK
jgi:glycosyltransferase involved in cell wall biosynthesis